MIGSIKSETPPKQNMVLDLALHYVHVSNDLLTGMKINSEI